MNSIQRSLKASEKRHIFITGARGVGKSTLFAQIAKFPCLTTFAVKGEGVYLKDGEEVVQIGIYDETLPGTENKMRPVAEGFAEAVRALEQLMQSESRWVGVDEIGYLETEDYQNAFLRLLEHKQVAAVVRKQETPFLQSLLSREDALVVDLDGNRAGCVIMASGLGRRFGGNKLMAELGGKPVVQWGIDAAKAVFSKVVVVTRHADVAALCERQGVPAVLHDLPYRSDTVRLGLEALGDVGSCLFLPGDQPFVTKESLAALVLASENSDRIWRLGGKSPAIFPKWTFESLKNLPQGKGGSAVISQHGAKSLEAETEWELRDIDTPQDLSCFCAGICCN